MTRSRWGLVGLAAAFYVYTVAVARVGFSPYDDAVFVYGGWAMSEGHVPYRDFWTLYNPGQFVLIAAFFRVFGDSVLAFRFFASALVAGSGLLVWDICRRVYWRSAALCVSSLFVLWLGAGSALYPFHENHTLTSIVLLLASVDLLLAAMPVGRPLLLALAGLCAGACFVVRQDAVLYVVLPEIVAVVLWRILEGSALRDVVRRLAIYLAGAAAPAALMLAFVLATAPSEWWQQAIVFPLTANPALRSLPFSFQPLDFSGDGTVLGVFHTLARSARQGFFYYLPFLLALFAIALVVMHLRRREGARALVRPWGFALVTLVLVASLDYARVRSDFEHIFPSILLSFLVLPGIVRAIADGVDGRTPRRAVAAVGAVVLFFALLIPVAARVRTAQALGNGVTLASGPLSGLVIDNRDAGGTTNWEDVRSAADYIRAHTDDDDRLFVSSQRNDVLLSNYPALYVLTERLAGTVHAELYPGVTTTAEVQRTIISELQAARVDYVVRWPAVRQPCVEPNLACHPVEKGAAVLDEYLRDEYEPDARFGVVEILRRSA